MISKIFQHKRVLTNISRIHSFRFAMTYQPSMAKSFSTYLRRNEEEENRDEEDEDVELDMDSPAAKDFYYNPLAHE